MSDVSAFLFQALRAIVTAGLVAALPVAPCRAADGSAGPSGADERSLRIGMVNALTGSPSALGQSAVSAARAVFADVNAHGGVHGRHLVLDSADDAYDPLQTVERTLELVQREETVALLGYVGTAGAVAVLPLLEEYRIPLVGVVSGAAALRGPDQHLVLNSRASYADEAETLVDRLVGSGSRRFGIVYQHDGFGHDVRRSVVQALKKRGLVLQASAPYQRNTVAVQGAVQAMLATRPDAVILAASAEPAVAFMRQARAAGLASRFASVSFIGLNDSALSRLGPAVEALLVTQVVPLLQTQTGIETECRRALAALGPEPLDFASFEGCINAYILLRALDRAGPEPTRAKVIAALDSIRIQDSDDAGASWLPDEAAPSHRVYLTQVSGGKFEPLH